MRNKGSSGGYPPSSNPSGFSVIAHSRFVQALGRVWACLNNLSRPLLPVLYLLMAAVVIAILGVVVFVNQHSASWYDEVCLIDPAFHRVTAGIWHTIAQWYSFEVVPFAPNYPLPTNILRLPIALFGLNFWLFRSTMLVLGFFPVLVLLWLCRRKGFLESWREMLQALYCAACFTAFSWALCVRSEAFLLSVVTLLVVAWACNRPVLLFFAALLVPLCGLQWNVLLLPTALHWLFFGGRFRNPLLVAIAFCLSTVASMAAYHLLGMWPSYVQEVARVGSIDAVHTVTTRLARAWSMGDFNWFFFRVSSLDAMLWLSFAALGAIFWKTSTMAARKWIAFSFLSVLGSVFFIALVGRLNYTYTYTLALLLALVFPIALRPAAKRHPLLLLLFVLSIPLFTAKVYCARLLKDRNERNAQWMRLAHPDFSQGCWMDEAALESALSSTLSPGDVVMAPPDFYFALRAKRTEMFPVEWAFDLSKEQRQKITALFLDASSSNLEIDQLIAIRAKSGLPDLFDGIAPSPLPADPEASFPVTTEELLSAIAAHWKCTFTEIPFPASPKANTIRYRLFRPDWPVVPEGE